MANNSRDSKGLKWSAVGLLITIVAIAIVAYAANSMLFSNTDSSNQSSLTPNPTQEATIATITPTEAATPNPTRIPVPVDFTYKSGSQYAFTITADVDLNDGMSSQEALTVAKAFIDHDLKDVSYYVKSTRGNDTYWEVDFNWEMSSLVGLPNGEVNTNSGLGHFFNVYINLIDRSIDYARCM
jgi:hypothetical protein